MRRGDYIALLIGVICLAALAGIYELAGGDSGRVPAPPPACTVPPEPPPVTNAGGMYPPRVVL